MGQVRCARHDPQLIARARADARAVVVLRDRLWSSGLTLQRTRELPVAQ